MFHKFSWVLMVSLGVAGYFHLQQMTDENRLVGTWETGYARTLTFNGTQATPEATRLMELSGYAMRIEVTADGRVVLTEALNGLEFRGVGRDNAEARTKNARILDIYDEAGELVYAFQWTLLDDNGLKTRHPGGDIVCLRRVP